VSIKKDEDPIVAINPTYGEPRGEMTGEEGCLSIPGVGAEITRPASVLVKGLYLNGDSFQFRAEPTPEDPNGVLSRVCQHEIDHLNGKLFFERISSTIIRRKIDPALEDLEWRYKRKRKGK
jgi:peptide deformylase